MASFEQQTITLSDGRVIGYAEYGDLKGKPILLFHGWPGSRLGAITFNELFKKMHVRLISIDRPGYGLSTFKKGRTLLDWTDDIQEITKQLKIEKFSVLGISGGGPYALACGYKIPDRITTVGVVSGLGPTIDEAIKGNSSWWRFLMKQYVKKPWLAYWAAGIHYVETLYFPKLFINWYRKKFDTEILTDTIVEQITVSKSEAFRSGVKGVSWDLVIYSGDWGFNLKDITKKVFLWYGAVDTVVPIATGTYFAQHLPHAVLKTIPNEAHSIFISHTEEILEALI